MILKVTESIRIPVLVFIIQKASNQDIKKKKLTVNNAYERDS